MKSLQVLLQRISRIPGGKSISTDRATQTDPYVLSESQRPIFRSNKIHRPTSKKFVQKVASHLPFHLLKSSPKSSFRSKVRSNSSLSSENVIESYAHLSCSLEAETQSSRLISLKESDNVPSPSSHSLPTDEIPCTPTQVSRLSPSSNNPVVSSHLEYGVNSSTHISNSNLASPVSPSILDGNESISGQQIHPNSDSLINSTDPSHNCHKNPITTSHILTPSTCPEFSPASQIHSLETSSELVPQDLIAVLDTEDVSDQQQAAVLFLRADDAEEEISHDEVAIQEEQLQNGNMPLEEEDTHPNIQQDSSLYSYSTIVEKDSNSSKSMKAGIDIVSSLRDHEEDLGLFCKDGVELDSMHSVSVEVVEKDGELMSIFEPNNAKEDDDENSTVLYVNGDVLTSKKDVHMGNAMNSKNTLAEHFFDKKLDPRIRKGTSFALIGMKMEEMNSRGGSEDDIQQFAARDCSAGESCTELPTDKEERSDNGAVIGLEGEIDPEDELGQNFVHIVVTASRVIPEKMGEEKLEDLSSKAKRGRCVKKVRNSNECTCTTCETTFPSLSSLQSHLKKKHGNCSQCDFCQKVFPTIGSLVDHCRDMHDGVGCFECEECGKRLKSRLSLRRHQESHQGRKEAVCHECGKTFCRGDYLIRHHQMVHAGERPYQCTHCSQRFLSRGHLRNHLSVHTGERNHKCGICGKMFSRSDKLREHVLRHLSAKRHTCPSCGRSYADKRDLNKHQMREAGCHPGEGVPMQIEATSSPLETQS